MKKFQEKLFKKFVNKRQRSIIFDALQYSQYRYKIRGNIDAAVNVGVVIDELKNVLVDNINQKIYTQDEVDKISENLVKETVAKTISSIQNITNDNKVHVLKVDLEKCKSCEHGKDCIINHILNKDNNDKEDKKEENVNKEVTFEETVNKEDINQPQEDQK